MAHSFIDLRVPQNQQNQPHSIFKDLVEDLGPKYIKQQNNIRLYKDVFGLSDEQARALAPYDFQQAIQLFESLGQREGGMEALQGLGGQQQMMQQQSQMPQQPQYREIPTQESVNQMANLLRQPRGLVEEQLKQIRPEMVQQLVEQENKRAAPGTSFPLSVAQTLAKPTKKEMREIQKLDLEERKFASEEASREEKHGLEKYKTQQPFMDKVYNEAQKASETLMTTERMKELEDEGLMGSAWNEFLSGFGLGIPALMGAPSEEFLKLRQGFLNGAREAFGGRVSNFELEQFLKTVPDLSNSPEGRKRIIANIDRVNRLKQKEAEIMDDIIEKNKGTPPLNLRSQVEKRIQKERKEAYKQFKEDLKRKVPAGSNKFVTGVARVGGNIARTAIPAAVGTFIGGPVGGAIGAGIGASAPYVTDLLSKLGGGGGQ